MATNSIASWLLVKLGNLRFIASYLLRVHVASADQSYQTLAASVNNDDMCTYKFEHIEEAVNVVQRVGFDTAAYDPKPTSVAQNSMPLSSPCCTRDA